MTDQELRALVRDAIAKSGIGPVEARLQRTYGWPASVG